MVGAQLRVVVGMLGNQAEQQGAAALARRKQFGQEIR
jgi:hypothetical protein